jgi:hypothetical protein
MTRPFEFSAWTKFQDQPVAHPGKIYDRADNEGVSACPVGGPAPYGRVLVRGPQSGIPGVPAFPLPAMSNVHADRYYTKIDSCCLPDKAGTHLKIMDGTQTFAAAGLALPTDAAGNLLVLGIGMWTEHGMCGLPELKQPFGLGDYMYQDTWDGQVGIATHGRIWCYTETDIEINSPLFFRTSVTAPQLTNGLSLLGAFTTVDDATTEAFTVGKVFRPGKAGGAFVLQLTGL